MRLLPFILFLLMANFADGQSKTLPANEIDSLTSAIDNTKGVAIAINQGTIVTQSTSKNSGGFSNAYFIDSITRQLLKVERHEALLTKDFTKYYFYNDSLILVTTSQHNVKNNKEILTGRYYFNNGMLLKKQEKGKPLSKPEAFLQPARLYIKDAYSMFNF
jgi:hypothetical protein